MSARGDDPGLVVESLLPDYDDIDAVTKFDPLFAAEQHTGKSYKDDEPTANLGLVLHLKHSPLKEKALRQRSDTHYHSTFAQMVGTFEDLGFERILETPFLSDRFEGCVERIIHWWHPDGILGVCESYTWSTSREVGTNSAKIFYNLRWKEGVDWSATSSGSGVEHEGEILWVGDHDVREGFRRNMTKIRKAALFVSPWVGLPWLSLNHYMQRRRDNDVRYQSLAEMNAQLLAERTFWVKQFPEHVQQAIGPLDRDD